MSARLPEWAKNLLLGALLLATGYIVLMLLWVAG